MSPMSKGVKIAISGKGGVGKTTICAALSRMYLDSGYKVIAVDADPDANLAAALGARGSDADIAPISRLKELIAERTGAQPGTGGGFFSINPKVDDLPEDYHTDINGVRLMVLGTVDHPGGGCICPESALLRRLVQHLIVERDEAIILDMEAGIEHLGRATAQAVDMLVVVVEPGQRSVQTANKIADLATGLGIPRFGVVINKVADESQRLVVEKSLADLPVMGTIAAHPGLIEIDLAGGPVWSSDELMDEVKPIFNAIQKQLTTGSGL